MAAIECKMRVPDVPGLEPEQLTVGREFFLDCTGPWSPVADPAAAGFEFQKGNEHFLKLLSMRKIDEGRIELKVTSYVAGKIDIPNLKFLDGGQTTELGPLSFEVKSVLDPAQPQQEPYGPFGPATLSVPGSWWLALAVALAVACLFATLKIRASLQRKFLLKKIAAHDSALSPAREFYQTLRRLKRDKGIFSGTAFPPEEPMEVVAATERAFRVFFMRRFRLPALDWSDSALLKAFRRENRAVFADHGETVQKLLKEFAAVRKTKKAEGRDAVQLAENARVLVEKLEVADAKGGR